RVEHLQRLPSNMSIAQLQPAGIAKFHAAVRRPEGAGMRGNDQDLLNNDPTDEAVRARQPENACSCCGKAGSAADVRAHLEKAGGRTTTLFTVNVEHDVGVVQGQSDIADDCDAV